MYPFYCTNFAGSGKIRLTTSVGGLLSLQLTVLSRSVIFVKLHVFVASLCNFDLHCPSFRGICLSTASDLFPFLFWTWAITIYLSRSGLCVNIHFDSFGYYIRLMRSMTFAIPRVQYPIHLTLFWFQSVQQVRNEITKYPEVTDWYVTKDEYSYYLVGDLILKRKIHI